MIKNFVHNLIENFLFSSKLLIRLRKWRNPPVFPSADHLLEYFAQNNPTPFFIQIGANKGQLRDPIYGYIILKQWAGILVEPQKKSFDQLKKKINTIPILLLKIGLSLIDRGKDPFILSKHNQTYLHGLTS